MKKEGPFGIYVGNLPSDTIHRDLFDIFENCGEIVSADLNNRTHAVFGFIEFAKIKGAKTAIKEYDGSTIRGTQISVEWRRGENYDNYEDEDEEEEERLTSPSGPKMFFSGLPKFWKKADLLDFADVVGEITEAFILPPQVDSHSACIGLVTYRHAKDARRALEELSGEVRHNYNIRVSYATKTQQSHFIAATEIFDKPSNEHSCLFIRNVPVYVKYQTVIDAFSCFGEVNRWARVPGYDYGFLDFIESADAEKALNKGTILVEDSRVSITRSRTDGPVRSGMRWSKSDRRKRMTRTSIHGHDDDSFSRQRSSGRRSRSPTRRLTESYGTDDRSYVRVQSSPSREYLRSDVPRYPISQRREVSPVRRSEDDRYNRAESSSGRNIERYLTFRSKSPVSRSSDDFYGRTDTSRDYSHEGQRFLASSSRMPSPPRREMAIQNNSRPSMIAETTTPLQAGPVLGIPTGQQMASNYPAQTAQLMMNPMFNQMAAMMMPYFMSLNSPMNSQMMMGSPAQPSQAMNPQAQPFGNMNPQMLAAIQQQQQQLLLLAQQQARASGMQYPVMPSLQQPFQPATINHASNQSLLPLQPQSQDNDHRSRPE